MRLRQKTLIIVVVLTASVILALYGSTQVIVASSVAQVEQENTRREVGRALNNLSSELTYLDNVARDWATWDDIYAFVEDGNPEFAKSNLVDQTFTNLNINLLVIVNSSGHVVFGGAFDLANTSEMPIPEELGKQLSPTGILVHHTSEESTIQGILVLGEMPVLIASRPILTSNGQGPIRGALIMGVFLDPLEISRLSDIYNGPIAVHRIQDSGMPSDFRAALTSLSETVPIVTRPLNQERVAGYALLDDIYGEPALVLRIDEPRDLYAESRSTMLYLALSLLAGGLTFGAATLLGLERLVLSPLTRFSTDVSRITETGDISSRIPIRGGDEFSSLAGTINVMLQSRQQMDEQILAEHDLALRLAAAQSLDEALPSCLEAAIRVSKMDSGGIYIIDPASGDLNLACAKGLPKEFIRMVSHFPADSDRARLVRKGETIYARYVETGLSLPASELCENIRANAIIPVLHQERVIGCFNIASHMLDEVPFASRRAMETVAAQVGNAVARIQVQESLRESEGRYRALFDSASDAIFIHDMGDRFLEVNKVACERLEYSRDELLQMTPAEINSPKSPELVRKRAEEVRRSGHGFFEIAHVRRDGTVFPVELSSRIIEYKGKPAVLSIARDITRRKQAEDALRASEMKYRTLFEKIPQGIYQTTLEGKLLAANPALVQLLGYNSEIELLAVNVESDLYVNPKERRRWIKELEIRGEIHDAELVLKRKDGGELTVLDNAHLVCDDQGTLLYHEGTLTDITERKRMEKELAVYSEHLQELVDERTKKLVESEERFRDLADLLPQIVFEMDRDGNFTFLNRIATATTGYTAEDVQKELNALRLFAPKDRERRKKNVELLLRGESLGANEYLMQRKDGTTFPAIVHSAPIVRANEITGLRGIAIDITDRKRAEEELRVARERLEYVITSNPAIIFTGKPRADLSDYNVTYMSNSVVSMLGFKPQEFIGRPEFWDGHVHPDDLRRYPIEVQPLWKEGQFTFEYRFLHRDGTYRWIREEAKAVRDEAGKPVEVIGYWTDVTEWKRIEEQLVRSERLAAIGETVMMVGHDLRNPLQVMVNSLALWDEIHNSMPSDCRDFADKRGVDRLLERIERQLEYMNKIISDLQDYARPVKPEPISTDLLSFVKETISTIQIPENIQVSVESAKDVGHIMLDPALMKRVFTNLITNAIQAMPNGGTLIVSMSMDEDSASIVVKDTGIGIPDENLSRIFQPLFTTKSKGQGLGLAVCKRLVEAHGGNITVKSKAGIGTTFSVILPLK